MPPAARVATASAPIAVPGRNCWRREPAGRVAFLIDGAAYFAALAAAFERARHCILIAGWDFDSRTRIRRGPGTLPATIGPLLNAFVARRRGLRIYVLNWDFAVIYALEREMLPLMRLDWSTHRRLRYRLDGNHPLGASHHQKIVVVDDAVAFLGGLDICERRWDLPAHRADDPRRVDHAGRPYPPFHDVQLALDGAAAAALGALVRTRWKRATGRRLRPVVPTDDPWPPGVVPDLERVPVALARTEPQWMGRGEVREVERLHLDAIAAARRSIYIENQYLTAGRIGEALATRLAEADGPEVVIVGQRECTGWLEEGTMGVLRARLVARLREADRFDRLRVCWAAVPGGARVNIHSKIVIVDDTLVRIGSANLNNRSMGLDTECDAAIEAEGDAGRERAIAGLRHRLLGEHLGVGPEEVGAVVAETGSLVAAVDRLRGGPRTLEPIECALPDWLDAIVPDGTVVDPERPIDAAAMLEERVPADVRESVAHPFLRGAATMLALALAIAVWTLLEARDTPGVSGIAAWSEPLRESPLAPLGAIALFTAGSFLFVPVTVLILATVFVFGMHPGFLYALGGTFVSAGLTYGLGRLIGRRATRFLAGKRLNRLTRRLAANGAWAVAAARLSALAPFTTMNLVAGASRLPFRDYALGTLLGTVPGVIVIAVLAAQLVRAVAASALGSAGLLAGVGALFLAVGLGLQRSRSRRRG